MQAGMLYAVIRNECDSKSATCPMPCRLNDRGTGSRQLYQPPLLQSKHQMGRHLIHLALDNLDACDLLFNPLESRFLEQVCF